MSTPLDPATLRYIAKNLNAWADEREASARLCVDAFWMQVGLRLADEQRKLAAFISSRADDEESAGMRP